MGTIERPDGDPFVLLARTLVGRGPTCDLVVPHRSVSSEHAVISWSEGAWWIRDLASRNGTAVGGVALEPGQPARLEEGQALRLGLADEHHVVLSVDGPDSEPAVPPTAEATLSRENVILRFRVSSDEEHVAWAIVRGPGVVELGDRVHTYLMLTLARARLRDAQVPEATRGWCYADELARGLGITPEVLKVYVYRARQQLLAAGVAGGSELLERRAATNQIRLATDRIEVERS